MGERWREKGGGGVGHARSKQTVDGRAAAAEPLCERSELVARLAAARDDRPIDRPTGRAGGKVDEQEEGEARKAWGRAGDWQRLRNFLSTAAALF